MPAINTLTNYGFEPSEAEIYQILVENGEMSVPRILQKTQLSRASVYDSLTMLMAKDLLDYRKDGRTALYKPTHPNKLFGLIEQKKRETALLNQEMEETIRGFTGAFNLSQNRPGVRFFEGEEGIKEVTFDSLKSNGDILTYLDVDATQKYIAEMNKEYVAERVRLNIKKRMIVPDTPQTRERYKNYSPLLEVRLMPPNIKPFRTITQIYNNTVSFSTLNEQKMIGVIIEDEQIAELHRSVFEFVWQSLPDIQLIENKKSTPPPSIPPPPLQPPPAATS
ncbi:MAG: helix-turn-helix domain-containing protein [Patescibacteria group bacterium]